MENETFKDADRPFYQYNSTSDYFYCLPWNYNKDINKTREYPLVIYLHGWGGAGNIKYLHYLGYDTKDSTTDKIAKSFQKDFLSFVLVPQSYDDAWNADKLIKVAEEFITKYRIDNNRIYLIGYSMGGSGSYLFANAWYDYNKRLFAGIIRLAGQSQTVLRDEIAARTSIWLHIGLDDTPLRVNITREAYDFLKSKHPEAIESTTSININGISGTLKTLSEKNTEIIKLSEYKGVAHGVDLFPFEDGSLIRWLFNQNLK